MSRPAEPSRVFYVKLGKGGAWEADAISSGKLRFGWGHQTVADINAERWDAIESQLRLEHHDKPGVATTDLNRLRDIAASSPADAWVTFYQSKMWWTHLSPGPVEEDTISKFRRTAVPWSDRDAKGRLLLVTALPGSLTQLQGFRGTVCQVRHQELLKRVLAGDPSPIAERIATTTASLVEHLAQAIKSLHWKDFETLVDLVFSDAGWVRVSVLGERAKGYDLELREPITNERYVVQVKSRASLKDLNLTIARFGPDEYRRVFFVVHSPAPDLDTADGLPDHVELIGVESLAQRVVDTGLITWVEEKTW